MVPWLKGREWPRIGRVPVDIALVALAATAGMSSAASYINSAFIRMGQKLGGYISYKGNTVEPMGQ